MLAGNYADQSFKLYAREMQYLFNYYDQKKPSAITSNEIIDYVCYLKKVHQASHAKMKMFANACKFFLYTGIESATECAFQALSKEGIQTSCCHVAARSATAS